jgi:3-oxoacyl-[acyl-carrier protein] reductase
MAKIVMITGASRGLGKEMALELAEAGYDLWLTYQSSDAKAEEVKSAVEAKGSQCKLMKFDISDYESSTNVIKTALKDGTPWGLINNAGITADGLFMRMKNDQWDRVVKTGLNGFYNVTQPIVSAMVRKKEGRIINISSVVGLSGNPGQVNYAAAKAGLVGVTKSLALEVARRNILVNCIAPGFIETDMTEDLNTEELTKNIPLGKLGQPKDIAKCALFLLGDGSEYITGQTISINGGIYL